MSQTSPLSESERQALRGRLQEEKRSLEAQLEGVRRTLAEMAASQAEERTLSTHMADLGTDTASQEVAQAQAATLGETLQQVDQALARMEQGTYGLCVACGRPIPLPRLKLMPYAARDVECQTRYEKERRRSTGAPPRPAVPYPAAGPQRRINQGDVERRAS